MPRSASVSISETCSPRSAPDGDELVEGQDRDERDLRDDVVQLAPGDAESLGHLLLGRLSLQHRLEVGVRLLDLPRLEPDRPRDPVHRTELVDDGALDARDRVGLELVAAARFELREGVDEAEHAVADEVGLVHARGQARRDPARHVLHERGVVQDQLLARVVLTRALEPMPLLPELVVHVRRHGDRRVDDDRLGARLRLRLRGGLRLRRSLGRRLLRGGHAHALGWLCS